jgi:general secretion pathway protein D
LKFYVRPSTYMRHLATYVIGTLLLIGNPLNAQTIAEKKAGIATGGADFDKPTQELLQTVNTELVEKETELRRLYREVQDLYEEQAPAESFHTVLEQINTVRDELNATSDRWREAIDNSRRSEGYALWNQPATTLEQLVIDYGSQEYVYVIPPEIGSIKISVASTIPVPRALWTEMLEMILAQNSIGVRQLNPYLRLLYPLKKNQAGITLITNQREDLEYLPLNARVGFFVSPDPSEVRRVGFFLERFLNPNTTTLQMVGRDMLIVTTVAEVKELLKLYDFVSSVRGTTEYKLVPLLKADINEMTKVLEAMFEQFAQKEAIVTTDEKGSTVAKSKVMEGHGLKVIPLKDVARAVFLVGTREEIMRAEAIIREVESSIGSAREKIVYTYHVKHSDPERVGEVVARIYELLVVEGIGKAPVKTMEELELERQDRIARNEEIIKEGGVPLYPPGGGQFGQYGQYGQYPGQLLPNQQPQINIISNELNQRGGSMYKNPFPTVYPFPTGVDDTPGFFQSGQVSINPTPIFAVPDSHKVYNVGRNNFLVEPRTGIIVMVVDPNLLPRIKALLRRIDVPKKMVQLDVLLIEYRNKRTNNFGLNLLSIGGCASNTRHTAARFDDVGQLTGCTAPCAKNCAGGGCCPNLVEGMFEFLLTRPKSGNWPAFDLAYRFLMEQEENTINANPSIMTVNEEEARIQIKEEISISTGIVEVVGTNQNVGPKDAFTRTQYGTDIKITPTIHALSEDPEDAWDNSPDYVTLKTYILFDDVLASVDPERPNVLRRNITNVVRVADGQTAVIGGLKRKGISDKKQMVPGLGESCIGNAFSKTDMLDTSTEMFIFITPTIIYDQCEGVEKVKRDQLFRRPGDIPLFMCAVDEARNLEREQHFWASCQILNGRHREECVEWGDDACNRPRVRGFQRNRMPYYNGCGCGERNTCGGDFTGFVEQCSCPDDSCSFR